VGLTSWARELAGGRTFGTSLRSVAQVFGSWLFWSNALEVQLCIQADAGTGSSFNPATRPARLNAALDLMNLTSENSSTQDGVLRRIGRNVVNFQCLEAGLRGMIPSLASTGTLRDFKSSLLATGKKHKKSSLGTLADTFFDGIFSKADELNAGTENASKEVSFRTSLQIKTSPELEAEQRKSLLKLVIERNRLIHSDALKVDFNSPEECAIFSKRLDEQNERIRAQLLDLNALRQAHSEALEELIRYIQTDEFLTALQGTKDGA